MALATAAELIARCDTQIIGDLITDDDPDTGHRERPSRDAILASDIVTVHLDDATALFLAAVKVGGRYSAAQLEGLTGSPASYVKRMVCDICVALLFQRRPDKGTSEIAEQFQAKADKHLKALKSGDEIIGLDDNSDAAAGVISTDGPTSLDLTDRNLIDERMHRFFPGGHQRLPHSRR